MRVITGEYRGRKLETPIGRDIRPTSDKVKEAIFNILMNDTYDRVFCDLFTGTGNLGIEALSRGARTCYFCDSSKDSIRLTKGNILHCGAQDKAVILHGDYQKCLQRIHEKVDVFLLDPPYHAGLYENCFRIIDELDLLARNGIILTEHGTMDPMPEETDRFYCDRRRRYGKTMVSIYRRKEDREDQSQPEEE